MFSSEAVLTYKEKGVRLRDQSVTEGPLALTNQNGARTTPASGFLFLPLLKVDAKVEEQLSSYKAVLPSFMAELMEIVHMLDA